MAWYDLKRKKKVTEEKEPTVRVKTGKFKLLSIWGSSNSNILADNKDEYAPHGCWYEDHRLEVPLTEAVQYLVDHLGIQIRYEPAKEESVGRLFKPTKRKRK